jgi:hypothetical protein
MYLRYCIYVCNNAGHNITAGWKYEIKSIARKVLRLHFRNVQGVNYKYREVGGAKLVAVL